MASWLGHTQIVTSLLRAGADPNIPEEIFLFLNCVSLIFFFSVLICLFNFTPLHRAAIRGYTEVVQQLIKGGADPNAVDYEGISKINIFLLYTTSFCCEKWAL